MIQQQFSPGALWWNVTIKLEAGEFLFYKNNETHPFYYFLMEHYDSAHMLDKNWFTKDMHNFIIENITL